MKSIIRVEKVTENYVDIWVSGKTYRISGDFDNFMRIHSSNGETLMIKPCVANEVCIR